MRGQGSRHAGPSPAASFRHRLGYAGRVGVKRVAGQFVGNDGVEGLGAAKWVTPIPISMAAIR